MPDAPRLAAFALALIASGCGATTFPPLPSQAEWSAARARLAALRAIEPTAPAGAVVAVTLREPRSGKTFHARGAVAVAPHATLRMMLLGPGGATALDVWATKDRYRFEVPALGLLRRGGAEDDATLPIGFFRWWFLAPLEGRLLTSVGDGLTSARLVLRDEQATVDMTLARAAAGDVLTAARRRGEGVDSLRVLGTSLGLRPGDRVVYDGRSGVHVEVLVESLAGAPDPAAFVDPDAPAGAVALGVTR